MRYKQNLHTHSTYCDGKDTPEEMVQEAIVRGFDSLGFSMHSYVPYSQIGSLQAIEDYKREILRLKDAYQDQIKIFLGIEYDIMSTHSPDGFAYTIASTHCMQRQGEWFDFDGKPEHTRYVIDHLFGGDAMAFAKCYYEAVASIPQYGQFDIIGHFDLMTKNNEKLCYLDTTTPEYLRCAFETIHALKGKVPLFEVNTGCIGRGYRSTPYPQMELLQEFRVCGFGAVITSDCHNKQFLDCNFADAEQMLLAAGFQSVYILTDNGFLDIPIS